MTLYDKLRTLRDNVNQSYWARRLYAEASYMICLSSVNGGIYDSRLDEVIDIALASRSENGVTSKEDVITFESALSDLSAEAKKLTVYCAAHAHIDMNWMWGYQETAAVTVDTFRTMLDLMREYPDFKFSQSQASTYKIIEDNAPEMLEEIKERIHEGRWELSASTWVETDKNMPSGESLSRHILYTKRYLAELFDIDPDSLRLDFEPDTFGHNISIPEICQNGGVDYYYHCRANSGDHDIYRWRGRSGKELLVYRDPHFYGIGIDASTFDNVPLLCQKNGVDTFLYVYGVGDHGGGPTRCDINAIIDCGTFPLYPTIKFGTYAEFFAAIEKFRDSFPVVEHELNYIFTGCYTSQSRIKTANRIAESRAYDAEFLSAAANAMTGASPKNAIYERAWRSILFNHFHDILPGSGVIDTREYALGKFQDSLAAINTNANTAMRNIADAIDVSVIPFEDDLNARSQGGGVGAFTGYCDYKFPNTERGRGKVRAIHLYNSTMYPRHEAVEVTVWDYNYDLSRAYFTDSDGNVVPSQAILSNAGHWGHNFTLFLIEADVPAFGYATYILNLREYDDVYSIGQSNVYGFANGERRDFIYDNAYVLENSKIKASFDPFTLAITELTDKLTGESYADAEHPTALFRYIIENPRYGMTSWRVGPYMKTEVLNSSDRKVRVIDYGVSSMRKYIKYQIAFASSKIVVTAELRGESSHIDYNVEADWLEVGNGEGIPQLNFTLPVTYTAESYLYDIPMGLIEREDIAHDVPAESFIRIGKRERAAYIMTETKYGYRGHDNAGSVTIIRSSNEPDPYPELGKHKINFAIGICSLAEQKREAESYCHPISSNAGYIHKGGHLPLKGSVASLEGDIADSVMISGIKNAEDGGFIVRLAETRGSEGGVTISLSELVPSPSSAELVDITERHTVHKCVLEGRKITLCLKPYTMATVLIK